MGAVRAGLEKDSNGNQQRFCARVSGSKTGESRVQICSRDGKKLVDEKEVREHSKEHSEELYGTVAAVSQHSGAVRSQWMVSQR